MRGGGWFTLSAGYSEVGPRAPLPSIRKLTIPALWLLGEDDQHVPSLLSTERLATVSVGHEFEAKVYTSADHFLLVTEHALLSEALRSNRYGDGVFRDLGGWLGEQSGIDRAGGT